MQKHSLTVLIPAYNEEKYIKSTVLETLNFLKPNRDKIDSFEIIICINGSTDNTEQIAKKLSEKYPEVRYISTNEKGAGIAIKLGIQAAKKEIISWVFADGEMDYTFLTRGISFMDQYDFINSSRKISGHFGVENREVSFSNLIRKFLSKACRVYTRLMIPLNIYEIGVVKMFKREWAQNKLDLTDSNWGIQSEFLMQASLDDLKIAEIPIEIKRKRDIKDAKLNVIKETYSLFKTITKAGLKIRIAKLKKFFSRN